MYGPPTVKPRALNTPPSEVVKVLTVLVGKWISSTVTFACGLPFKSTTLPRIDEDVSVA